MKRLLVPAALLLAASCGSDTTTASTTQPEPIPTTVPVTEAAPTTAPTADVTVEPAVMPVEPTAAPTVAPTSVPTVEPTVAPVETPTATPAPAEPTVMPTAEPSSDTQAQRAALAAARAQWQADRPDSYSMTYRLQCDCYEGPWRVVVEGASSGVGEHLDQPGTVYAPYLTIESIFADIEDGLDQPDLPIEVDYDERGFPRSFFIAVAGVSLDEGVVFMFTMDEFVPNDTVPEPQDDRAADRQALADAMAQWAAAGLADYDYTFRRPCFCAPEWVGPYAVSVRGGVVVGATYDGVDLLAVDALRLEQYSPHVLTVAGVFAEIGDAIARADSYTVEYHGELGYPTDVYIDWDKRLADEEIGYQIEGLAQPAG